MTDATANAPDTRSHINKTLIKAPIDTVWSILVAS